MYQQKMNMGKQAILTDRIQHMSSHTWELTRQLFISKVRDTILVLPKADIHLSPYVRLARASGLGSK